MNVPGELTITRVLNAPRPLVWTAFTTPEHVAAFWGGSGTSVRAGSVVVDLRIGGTFRLVTVGADGAEYPKQWRYADIEPPHRIVLSEPDTGITTTITFADLGARTELVIHQTDVPPELRGPQAQAGLAAMTGKLDRLLAHLQRA